MFGIHDYWIFVATGILLNLTPGQDTLYIAGRSMAGGVREGVASALGVGVGGALHVLAATLGLSAVLATSAMAFGIVKLLGAAYLVVLGLKLLLPRRDSRPTEIATQAGMPLQSAFHRGILTNVLNPKVALFFLAFLPQFIEPDSAHRALSFLILGATFVLTGTSWCLVIAVLTARTSARFRRSSNAATMMQRVAGAVFVALGIRLALERAA